ncbi:efflux RND transporter periplasmic adaptor subunit [Billgrantia gudaonensis]|uniref:RND family efflux transporter, MFP subunit n=1 Tax=Billgrantia gudaonensis TaxID=376427 RepID=A0A1G8T4C9_9GAMM|nr:efflux RND transporter periplasmic adaptor subunit [Halomonas gudaonensis]SDJ36356.1 RND family efflux transporter, MFP subunit [Halomonas gudaonensis]
MRFANLCHGALLVALSVSVIAGPVQAQQDGGAEEKTFDEISCLVEPGREATLSSHTPGVIDEILVEPGERVEAGDRLFALKRDVERANLELERARVDYASRQLQRNQRLIERGMLSDSERDEIDTELRLARLQANLGEARLDDMVAEAPFSGMVARQQAEEGEYIDATPVLDIVQLDPLRVEAILRLEAYGHIAVGDELEVALLEPVNETVVAEVDNVDGVIDPTSGTFAVELVFANPRGEWPAGINCRLP